MPTPTYDLIATTTTSGNTITISSIPSTYRDLVFVSSFTTNQQDSILIRVNNDTGANYSWIAMHGDGSNTQSIAYAGEAYIDLRTDVTSAQRALVSVNVLDYAQTNKHKPMLIRSDNAGYRTVAVAGRWASTSAITSITIYAYVGSTNLNGTFSLYGIVS